MTVIMHLLLTSFDNSTHYLTVSNGLLLAAIPHGFSPAADTTDIQGDSKAGAFLFTCE